MADLDQAIYQFNRTDEEAFVRQQAKSLGVSYVSLVGYPISPNTLTLITFEEATRFRAIPYLKADNKLRVAIDEINQETMSFIQELANRTKFEIMLALCSKTSFEYGLTQIALREKKSTNVDVSVSKANQESAIKEIQTKAELEKRLETANATQVLDLLFSAATGMEASDIHMEPQADNIRIRFRIDGVLQEITTLNPTVYKQVVSRVKYLAKMKLDVKANQQDGRFTVTVAGTEMDIRISTLPAGYGEILDMRLLRAHAEFVKLDDLSLEPTALAMIKEAIALPHGMILVTGPTGSGKTTTLYAVLDYLNKPGVKIVTLEDPIEYRLQGIDQVQVSHDENGMSFADALLGVLRQDPDIIMVGEIRDRETAEIGLQSAMTGHLFLSTLHTNNAPASLSRLIDMGVEPYKIAGAINLLIAQRLVRKICATCNGAGCDICHQTGYKGRIPIIEVLKPSKELDQAIMNKASVRDLYDLAIKEGMVPMKDDGMKKVASGITTEDEVNRVTAEFTDD